MYRTTWQTCVIEVNVTYIFTTYRSYKNYFYGKTEKVSLLFYSKTLVTSSIICISIKK